VSQTQEVKPAKILIIEDNRADIAILRHALDQQGEEYDLEVLTDGEAALLFVHEHRMGKRAPDPCVILLDLHLPKHNGMEVLGAIRLAPALSHIQVVVLTGLADPKEEADARAMGAIFREKPSSLNQFLQLAAEILAICKGSAEAAVR
jgi:CheY-like chemotaxis protein